MEDSDQFIVDSLRRLSYPLQTNKTSLNQIDSDDLIRILQSFFEKMNIDPRKFNIKDQTQKFRIATKIVDELNKSFGLRTDCNTLMSPTLNDLRKILMFIVSKSASAEEEASSKYESIDQKITEQKEKFKIASLKNWLKEDWIHPLISSKKFNIYRSYENFVDFQHPENFNSYLILRGFDQIKGKMGLLASFSRNINLAMAARKRNEQNSLDDKLFRARKRKNAEKFAIDLNLMQSLNADEWETLKTSKNTEKLIKKKMKEENLVENNFDEIENKQTMFNLEIKFQEETVENFSNDPNLISEETNPDSIMKANEENSSKGGKNSESSNYENIMMNKLKNFETDIETIKTKNKEEMEGLLSKIDEQEKKMKKLEQKKANYEEDNTKLEEEIANFKEKYKNLQKEAENLHNLLKNMESQEKGQKDLEKENSVLENEISAIETEWDNHKLEMQRAIEDFEEKIESKKEKFNQIREKIKQYEEDFEKLATDIRSDSSQIQALQVEYEKTMKDINRQTYIKKINDTHANLKKQKTEFGKINAEAKELESSIEFYGNALQRQFVEIENMMMMDFKKNEEVTKKIQKMYQDYKGVIDVTQKNLQEQGKKKVDSKQLEIKVNLLNSKNYKGNLEKMRVDLSEIKQENESLIKKIKN